MQKLECNIVLIWMLLNFELFLDLKSGIFDGFLWSWIWSSQCCHSSYVTILDIELLKSTAEFALAYELFIGTKIGDLKWPWWALWPVMTVLWYVLEPTISHQLKLDSHCQQQKCSPFPKTSFWWSIAYGNIYMAYTTKCIKERYPM